MAERTPDSRQQPAQTVGDTGAPSSVAGSDQPQLKGSQPEEGYEPVQVVIETPRGSRIKYKFDEALGTIGMKSVLPQGMVFPFNFGFVPHTRGGDGDPLDVLLLMEEPLFPGCRVAVRLIGVMVVEQIVDRETQRNDRLLAVADTKDLYSGMQTLHELPNGFLFEIEAFFVQYHKLQGKTSRTLARKGPAEAHALLTEARQRARP